MCQCHHHQYLWIKKTCVYNVYIVTISADHIVVSKKKILFIFLFITSSSSSSSASLLFWIAYTHTHTFIHHMISRVRKTFHWKKNFPPPPPLLIIIIIIPGSLTFYQQHFTWRVHFNTYTWINIYLNVWIDFIIINISRFSVFFPAQNGDDDDDDDGNQERTGKKITDKDRIWESQNHVSVCELNRG